MLENLLEKLTESEKETSVQIKYKESKFPFNILIFPCVMLYFEIVFSISTSGRFLGSFYALLFALFYGFIGYLLTTISKNKRFNEILATVLMSVGAIIYLVEYFVQKFFKIFYDINTILGGAGGIAKDYKDETADLIFSFDGIFKIILFFLPAVLYFTYLKKIVPTKRVDRKMRTIAAVAMVGIILISNFAFLFDDVHGPMYKKEYNFQNSVESFGLIPSLRRDLGNVIFGSDAEFEKVEAQNKETEPEEKEKEYPFNEMNLKFKKTSNSDIKKMNEYVKSISPSRQNEYTGLFKDKNLIMITAEAFTGEVIDEELTPTLYRLATKGINFTDYYQPASAGTTGGEFQNIFGLLPMLGGKSFKETARYNNYFTMGSQLDRLGYYGKAFHNNSYTYYDRHKTHKNLGYSDGFMGQGNGMEKYVKNCWPQSDLEMIKGTLPTYIDKEKFNIYYMSVSGHSGYSKTGNSMTKKNWEKVKDLPYSDTVKGYLAANLELEYAMEYLIAELEAKGIAKDTVICISSDHFPYGMDRNGAFGSMYNLSELYGYTVQNYIQRDHSRLILWCGSLEEEEPIIVDSPTSSLDIVPTLSNLFGTEFDSRLFVGRDVFSDQEAIYFNTNYDWKTDYGTYYSSSGKFVLNDGKTVPDDYVERIKSIVRNKIRYCQLACENDYFGYLFGKK